MRGEALEPVTIPSFLANVGASRESHTPARKEICARLSVWGVLGLSMNKTFTSPVAVTRIRALPAVSSTALNSSVAVGR